MVLEHRVLSGILETAIVSARLAGQRAMEELDFIKTSVKNDDEIVTQADSICQKIIIDRIKETYPDHGFIAEEGEQGKLFKQPPRTEDGLWWVIDPIDGTNNFANKMLLFTVSIAACYRGEPVVGVIFEPATDSIFTAVKDGDAQLNGRKIKAGKAGLDNFSSVGIDSHFGQSIPNWAQQVITRTKYRNLGSIALHFAYVAKGSLVGTVANVEKLWDIAAGTVIVESAGAIVTDWQGQKVFPMDLDAYQGESSKIIAANKTTHPEIIKLLK